jgi:nucleotide-binding universal stress UspA family protein
MNLDTVLVPLDGSGFAELALQVATGLTEVAGGRIRLLQTVPAGDPRSDPTDAEHRAGRDAAQYLQHVAERLAGLGLKAVETAVWRGGAASAIIEAARDADLIVMTVHGAEHGHPVLSRVTRAVLRGTRVPVLLVRRPDAPVEDPGEGGAAPLVEAVPVTGAARS